MNPYTNKFEELGIFAGKLVRPNGEPIPQHWSTFAIGETVTIKDYTFKVAYIGESNILFEPVSPVVIGEAKL